VEQALIWAYFFGTTFRMTALSRAATEEGDVVSSKSIASNGKSRDRDAGANHLGEKKRGDRRVDLVTSQRLEISHDETLRNMAPGLTSYSMMSER